MRGVPASAGRGGRLPSWSVDELLQGSRIGTFGLLVKEESSQVEVEVSESVPMIASLRSDSDNSGSSEANDVSDAGGLGVGDLVGVGREHRLDAIQVGVGREHRLDAMVNARFVKAQVGSLVDRVHCRRASSLLGESSWVREVALASHCADEVVEVVAQNLGAAIIGQRTE